MGIVSISGNCTSHSRDSRSLCLARLIDSCVAAVYVWRLIDRCVAAVYVWRLIDSCANKNKL